MNKEELTGKLQMVYVGDTNALNELIGCYDGLKQGIDKLQQENQELKKQLEELESIVGLRQKRNLINKFNKDDEEDKKKNPNRSHAEIIPDAEEVYRRYYAMKTQQKEFIEYISSYIKLLNDKPDLIELSQKDVLEEILEKYKSIIGVSDE